MRGSKGKCASDRMYEGDERERISLCDEGEEGCVVRKSRDSA